MVFSLCFVFYFYVPPFGIKLLVVQKHKSVSKNFQLKRNSNVRTDPENPLILCNLPLVGFCVSVQSSTLMRTAHGLVLQPLFAKKDVGVPGENHRLAASH